MQQQVEADKLRRKLDELMSDRALSSSDDEDLGVGTPKRNVPRSPGMKRAGGGGGVAQVAPTPAEAGSSSSSDEMPTEAQKARSVSFSQRP